MKRKTLPRVLVHISAALAAALMLLPIYWVISLSLRPLGETFVPTLIPREATLAAYQDIFTNVAYLLPFRASLIVASISMLLSLFLGVLAAYGLSRYRFSGRSAVLLFVLSNKMFPPVLLAISYFVLLNRVGLYDSLLGIILTDTVITLPFSLWMMRNYLDTIPRELDEAAIVDGCSRLGALFRVILPVSAPGLAATAVYCFVLAWNEFLFAYTFTSSPNRRVVTIAIMTLLGEFWTDYRALLAFSVLFSIPIMLIFVAMQRYLIRGLTAGTVK